MGYPHLVGKNTVGVQGVHDLLSLYKFCIQDFRVINYNRHENSEEVEKKFLICNYVF